MADEKKNVLKVEVTPIGQDGVCVAPDPALAYEEKRAERKVSTDKDGNRVAK